MRAILWICLAASGILFLLAFLVQVRRLRRGNQVQPGKLMVVVNWLLMIVFFVSLGGLVWTSFYSQPAGGSTADSSSSSHSTVVHHHNSYSHVSWQPQDLVLDANGEVKVTFKVPAGTSIKIIGERTQTVYKTIHAKDHDRKVKYTFKYAAKYELDITNRRGHHEKKVINVRYSTPASSSVTSSSSSSQPSAVSHSSSSTPATAVSRAGNATGISQSGNRQYNPQRVTPPAASQSSAGTANNQGAQPQ